MKDFSTDQEESEKFYLNSDCLYFKWTPEQKIKSIIQKTYAEQSNGISVKYINDININFGKQELCQIQKIDK